MSLICHAQNLEKFLKEYIQIWNDEVMNEYPQSINFYPPEWISLLSNLSDIELHKIDNKEIIEKIKDTSFEIFMKKNHQLLQLPAIKKNLEIPLEAWAFNDVKKKKRHEIQKIVPVLKQLQQNLKFKYVIDVGGGVGHLCRILSHYHSIPSISLDKNHQFQKIGIERLKKYRKLKERSEVEFINLDFADSDTHKILPSIFKADAFSLGLHTCGPLSNSLIQKSIDFNLSGLLNFGCCYYKINPETDFPISDHYKKNNFLKLNLYALSLGTRAHAQISFEEFKTKKRVKYYRYGLHLFLMKYFNNKFFRDVGECPIKVYHGPFSIYLRSKLIALNLSHDYSDQFFEQFYDDLNLQKELKTMWVGNIIRWQLGRAIEIYLLLDRCLYLKENGFSVSLEQYFDEVLSPRNIGILAINSSNTI